MYYFQVEASHGSWQVHETDMLLLFQQTSSQNLGLCLGSEALSGLNLASAPSEPSLGSSCTSGGSDSPSAHRREAVWPTTGGARQALGSGSDPSLAPGHATVGLAVSPPPPPRFLLCPSACSSLLPPLPLVRSPLCHGESVPLSVSLRVSSRVTREVRRAALVRKEPVFGDGSQGPGVRG